MRHVQIRVVTCLLLLPAGESAEINRRLAAAEEI
jgi:hypothetical protein